MHKTTRLFLLMGALLLLGALVRLNCRGSFPLALNDIANRDVLRISIASEPYVARHGRCPQSVGNLEGSLPDTDPWDTPYRITCCPGGEVLVVSAGADLLFETADDLTNRTYPSSFRDPLPPCSRIQSAE